MTLIWADRVRETSSTSGAGAITPTGAYDASFVTIGSKLSPGDTSYFGVRDGAGAWNTMLGTWDGTAVTRTTILAGSDGTNPVSLSGTDVEIWIDAPADWIGTRGEGDGTVTSVALSMPGIFTVTGSPVTGSGTLTATATGTSGGVPYFSASDKMASSAALTANALVLGGGAGAAPASMASLGTTTTVLHGNAAGAPTFGAVSLTADVTGTLPIANGGTGATSGTVVFATNMIFAGVPLTGAKFVSFNNLTTASGNNDLYTVPTGKKAVQIGAVAYINDTAGSINIYLQLKRSGSYYRMANTAAVTAGTTGFHAPGLYFIMSAGDVLALNDSAGSGGVIGGVLEFDDTVPLVGVLVTSLASSNTLYTVPTGKCARLLATAPDNLSNISASVLHSNDSGGSITRTVYYVPSGDAKGTDNVMTPPAGTALATAAVSATTFPGLMSAGDALVVDVSATTATQALFLTYYERDV